MANEPVRAGAGAEPRVNVEQGVEVADYEGVEYEDFWTGINKEKLDALEHAIVGELLPARGRRILEVGCGFGRMADIYRDRFDGLVLSIRRSLCSRTRVSASATARPMSPPTSTGSRSARMSSTRCSWCAFSTICPSRARCSPSSPA